jgi:hypothetical protein
MLLRGRGGGPVRIVWKVTIALLALAGCARSHGDAAGVPESGAGDGAAGDAADADQVADAQPAQDGGDAAVGSAADTGVAADRDAPSQGGAAAPAEGSVGDPAADPAAPTGVAIDCAALGCECYELRAHGRSSVDDTTPFEVGPGESYNEMVFDAPWRARDEPSVIVSQRALIDQVEVVHHVWLFDAQTRREGGTVSPNALATLLGIPAAMLASWTVGGDDPQLPDGVALEVSSDQLIMQLHHYNATGEAVLDRSGFELCVAPRSAVDEALVADVSLLGTENLGGIMGMPPGEESTFASTCQPARGGIGGDVPITVFAWLPHMHRLGRHVQSSVLRADGSSEVVFDQEFDPEQQLFYPAAAPVQLQAGDALRTACTYFNDTDQRVAFGESAWFEMCYLLTYAYPAGALRNGVMSLIGVDNTCWTHGD